MVKGLLTRHRRTALIALVVALAAGVYLWPAVARSSSRTDVLAVGDGQLQASSYYLGRRVRERGDRIDMTLLASPTSCSGLTAGRRREALHPEFVVISYRDAPPGCGGALAFLSMFINVARPAHVLLVLQPGPQGQTPDMLALIRASEGRKGITVVDPTRLLTTVGDSTRAACEWWDNCDPDGTVAIRTATGALTDAGKERVARAVASAIP